ncbi:hypothetical protein M1L60_13105 [Actinoplanes sp. TRM 88003]|uniref:Uncharacterized protein n=1 Tax=Paractinoplanes aksuensis TaxID=2939490 RepID=A0ABT1DL09_9ACTN|nr:hypothetical protein [Actinoplanes aksuensis]MCO8271531.1 hypothetical protein [Actinoplanes aksuensis]
MTTHTRTGRPVPHRAAGHYITRDHTVTGTPDQLANIVANHRNAGTLVALTPPRPVPGDRLQVVIRIREHQTNRRTVRVTSVGEHVRTRVRRSRRTRIAVIVTTITGTAAGLIAVAAYLIGELVELIAAHAGVILSVLALAAILAALAARSTGRRRRHCPGC